MMSLVFAFKVMKCVHVLMHYMSVESNEILSILDFQSNMSVQI